MSAPASERFVRVFSPPRNAARGLARVRALQPDGHD